MRRLSTAGITQTITLVLALAPAGFGQRPYVMTMIDFPDATGTWCTGINSEGEVVCRYTVATTVPPTWGSFLYRDGNFTPLPDFPGEAMTHPWSANPRGDIVGCAHNWGEPCRGYLFSRGDFSWIDGPGGVQTDPHGINPQGDIVGDYQVSGVQHGFLLSEDTFTTIDVPVPGALATRADGINPRGEIAGRYTDASKINHGFVLSGDVFTEIDFPEAANTDYLTINPRGDVAGTYTDSAGKQHGFVRRGDDFTTIDCPGASWTHVHGLNAAGELAGMCGQASEAHGFGLLLSRSR